MTAFVSSTFGGESGSTSGESVVAAGRASVYTMQAEYVRNGTQLRDMDVAAYSAQLCQEGHSGRYGRMATSARQGDTPAVCGA
jgi:hypothetical protein